MAEVATTLTWRVVEVVDEVPDARTLVLAPAHGGEPPAYKPGQFLTFAVATERPQGCARSYSLCSAPGDRHLAVTVKRTVDGYASNLLNDTIRPGDELTTLRPAGTFTPASLDDDLVLVAAGSGITPVFSILRAALEQGRARIALFYANRDEQSVIFAERLRELVAAYPDRLTVVHWLESVQGRPTATSWEHLLRAYADRSAFVCGPAPFMAMATSALAAAGMPSDRVTVEEFMSLTGDPFAALAAVSAAANGSAHATADATASTLDVHLDGELTTVSWPTEITLLDAMLAAGLEAPWSCREGRCSTCACYVTDGSVDLAHNEVLDARDLADGMTLACQARPTSAHVTVTYDA